jgi:dUTP pyrophosphatase
MILLFCNTSRFDYTEKIHAHNNKIIAGQCPDAGFNLYAAEDISYGKDARAVTFDTGVICAMTTGNNLNDYIAFSVEPRSSICKTPLRMSNGRGIIDAGYRGHLLIKCDSYEDFTMKSCTSYFQILSPTLEPFLIRQVNREELNSTVRGTGGFGSTGGN